MPPKLEPAVNAIAFAYAPMNVENPALYATEIATTWTNEQMDVVMSITNPFYRDLKQSVMRRSFQTFKPPKSRIVVVPSAPPQDISPIPSIPSHMPHRESPLRALYSTYVANDPTMVHRIVQSLNLVKFTRPEIDDLRQQSRDLIAQIGTPLQRFARLQRFNAGAKSHDDFPEIVYRGIFLQDRDNDCYLLTALNIMFHATTVFDVLFIAPLPYEPPWVRVFRGKFLNLLEHARSEKYPDDWLSNERWVFSQPVETKREQLGRVRISDIFHETVNEMMNFDFNLDPVQNWGPERKPLWTRSWNLFVETFASGSDSIIVRNQIPKIGPSGLIYLPGMLQFKRRRVSIDLRFRDALEILVSIVEYFGDIRFDSFSNPISQHHWAKVLNNPARHVDGIFVNIAPFIRLSNSVRNYVPTPASPGVRPFADQTIFYMNDLLAFTLLEGISVISPPPILFISVERDDLLTNLSLVPAFHFEMKQSRLYAMSEPLDGMHDGDLSRQYDLISVGIRKGQHWFSLVRELRKVNVHMTRRPWYFLDSLGPRGFHGSNQFYWPDALLRPGEDKHTLPVNHSLYTHGRFYVYENRLYRQMFEHEPGVTTLPWKSF